MRTILLEADTPREQFIVAWREVERVHALVGVVRDGTYVPIVANPFDAEAGQ